MFTAMLNAVIGLVSVPRATVMFTASFQRCNKFSVSAQSYSNVYCL